MSGCGDSSVRRRSAAARTFDVATRVVALLPQLSAHGLQTRVDGGQNLHRILLRPPVERRVRARWRRGCCGLGLSAAGGRLGRSGFGLPWPAGADRPFVGRAEGQLDLREGDHARVGGVEHNDARARCALVDRRHQAHRARARARRRRAAHGRGHAV